MLRDLDKMADAVIIKVTKPTDKGYQQKLDQIVEDMDPKVLAIFFRDLNEKAQGEVLKLYDIKSEEEANLNIFPLFILEKSDD